MPAASASELERLAVRGVEAPADAAVGHPLLDAREVVVVEPEAPAHGLAVGQVEHLRGGQALAGEVDQAVDHAEDRVRLAQRAVCQLHAQVGRAELGWEGIDVVVLVRHLAGAERRLDQRREGLDVRAHDDHVARLERRVVGEQVEDRVAQHLDLAGAAVAGVDLDAAVGGVEGEGGAGRVGPDVLLHAREEGVGVALDGMVVVGVVGADDQLQFPGVVPPGGEQPVVRERGRPVVAPANYGVAGRLRDLVPECGRGVQEEQVHVSVDGQGAQHVQTSGREAGEPEQRQTARKVDDRGLLTQPCGGGLEALGRVGQRNPVAQPAPQLGLPARGGRQGAAGRVGVVAGAPRVDHLGSMEGVAVEELGDVADAAEPPGLPDRVVLRPQVQRECAEPRLGETLLDHLDERPHHALGQPRVGVRLDPGCGGERVPDQPPGRREVDVRAHAVGAAGAGSESG